MYRSSWDAAIKTRHAQRHFSDKMTLSPSDLFIAHPTNILPKQFDIESNDTNRSMLMSSPYLAIHSLAAILIIVKPVPIPIARQTNRSQNSGFVNVSYNV
mmetsp:Transcript_2959/g.3504  ORF Transcript_2959/g.3504 Transcript_2959/m.3504 type:complete len:100 (+) Transcript_2959:2059-2358(+)